DALGAESRFLELRSRAEAGDVIAQRGLAELYRRCILFNLSPANTYSLLDLFARTRGIPGAYDGIKKRFAATCSGVDGGQVIPRVAYTDWFEQAARQGDTYSMMAMASENWHSLEADDYRLLAREVVDSADPEAVFALGDLLALAPESVDLGEFRVVAPSPYATLAWGIVGCRMGADCGPESYRMDSLCINTGLCNSGDFESAIRTEMLPVGQEEALDNAIDAVEQLFGPRVVDGLRPAAWQENPGHPR